MATLVNRGSLTTDIHQAIAVLTAQGRAAGLHMVLCTQYPSIAIIPNHIKTNLAVRVTGRMPSGASSMVVLDSHEAKELAPVPGRMIIQIGPDGEQVQTPYISDADIAEAVLVAKMYTPDDFGLEQIGDDTSPLKLGFDETDVVRLALEEFEGDLKAARIFELIKEDELASNTKVRALVKAVTGMATVEFGGLTYKPVKQKGNFYRLIPIEVPEQEEEESEEAALV
jgi:DNA segregation ATPase FtsK/SpoIIIE-like protein